MEFRRLHLIPLFLFLLLLLMQYRLWFQPDGIMDMMRLKKRLVIELQQNEILKKRNQDLMIQVQALQKNQDMMESRARQELGMVKKGETYYQLVK